MPFRPLIVIGTRPEAIKLAPIVWECAMRSPKIDATVCHTGQHMELVAPILEYFEIRPDVSLDVMRTGGSLVELAASCLTRIGQTIESNSPDCVVIQGDTTTAMCGALAGFYSGTPVVHVEAGLRTGDLCAPWPEELHRRVISLATALHAAPTERAAKILDGEGVARQAIRVTGNTVIDALRWTDAREREKEPAWRQKYAKHGDRRLILITGHRRESFGIGLENICKAIIELATNFPDDTFLYAVHPNPEVARPVEKILSGSDNIELIRSPPYPEFVWLMRRSYALLTDSGGVQEEAPSLGKPIVVTRETTERTEAIDAGAAVLVGTDRAKIVDAVTRLLTDPIAYQRMRVEENPFGDGHAAPRIVDWMCESFT